MSGFVVPSALRERFEAAGQGHVFKHVDDLTLPEAQAFIKSLEALDLDRVLEIHRTAFASESKSAADVAIDDISPLAAGDTLSSCDAATIDGWRQKGLEIIGRGGVAALILAGGQGTRLSSTAPKGLYDIGLPSKKSLFALNAGRIRRLSQLASGNIPLVVMTSEANDGETRAAFAENKCYGLEKEEVLFFSQGMLPAFMIDDKKLVLKTKSSLSWAPDGNGGVYRALEKSGTLEELAKRGVEYVHVVSVDNVLCRPCDPVFVGYCASKSVNVGSKAVWKASPEEKVGVLCTRRGRPAVVEYSELPRALAEERDAAGELVYAAGNVCNHLLSVGFLKEAANASPEVLPFHIARKAVPILDDLTPKGPNAIKLEAFIFDAFALAETQAALGVARVDEFAAVKNATGTDSPGSALKATCALGAKWVTAAGGHVIGDGGVEVPTELSYAGEGLEPIVKGRTFDTTKGAILLC